MHNILLKDPAVTELSKRLLDSVIVVTAVHVTAYLYLGNSLLDVIYDL